MRKQFVPSTILNNAFQTAENLAVKSHVCDEEELANNKADYQRKKVAHLVATRYFFFDRSFFLSCMHGFETHISGANSCSYPKGKDVVVSSEVKFDFRLFSSNNGTSIERGQFPEILSTVYYCF